MDKIIEIGLLKEEEEMVEIIEEMLLVEEIMPEVVEIIEIMAQEAVEGDKAAVIGPITIAEVISNDNKRKNECLTCGFVE